MRSGSPVITTTDDTYETPDAGNWAEDKGGLFAYYCEQFATAMKKRWDARVYIDLFAGAGKVRARETGKVLLGSPLLALAVRYPFDKYIFCERIKQRLEVLKRRVSDMHPTAQVAYVGGDVNECVREILRELPAHSPSYKVLGFCFADPFRMQDLKFATLLDLAQRYMDFLVHIPAMDPMRAWKPYLNPANHTVDDFLGKSDWRDAWHRESSPPRPDVFVARAFTRRMKEIGFNYGGFDDAVLIRSTEKNLPLYRLVFFSKHQLGGRFWRQATKGTLQQGTLF